MRQEGIKRSDNLAKQYRIIALTLLFVGLLCSAMSSAATDQNVFVIANRSLPFDTLSRKELISIFLQKKTIWEGEDDINIAILKEGETHRQFLWTYFGKTPGQYRHYWKKKVFSGKGRTPMTFRTEKDLMGHVALTKGAVGYISSAVRPSGVKVITITK